MIPGQKVYHTSIILGNKEFYFNPEGMQERPVTQRSGVPPSHQDKAATKTYEVGSTRKSGLQLRETLCGFFPAGSYDLVLKNCNKFTDCALAFLLSRRLPRRFCSVERLGEGKQGVLSFASGGRYRPNPKAEEFDLEAVILKVDPNAWLGTAEAGIRG